MMNKIRLGERLKVYHLSWTDEDLQAIIEQRLGHFSINRPRPYERLAELSEIDNLDAKVIKAANGNPRDLVILCDYLIEEHCRLPITNDNLYFTEDDFARALKRLDEYRGDDQRVTNLPHSPIDSLPTWLSVLVARYRDEQNVTDKLWCAFHLTQMSLQFIVCILLTLYSKHGKIDPDLNENLRKLVFEVQHPPSIGSWNQAINRIIKIKSSISNALVNSIAQFRSYKKVGQSLEVLISTRNDFAHGRLGIPGPKLLFEIDEHITVLLTALGQIGPLELVSIEDFDVDPKGQIVHIVRVHKGNVLIPEKHSRVFETNYQRNHIVLFAPGLQVSLDLKPFIVFEIPPEADRTSVREIYFFERLIDSQHNGQIQMQYINPITQRTFRTDVFVSELRNQALIL